MPRAVYRWVGLGLSYAFVFGLMALATFLVRGRLLPPRVTRKIIHIGVAHWWLIAMAFFDDPVTASIPPATFLVINSLALRYRFFHAMYGRMGARNWGTVYFPLSLLILVNLCWRGLMPVWVGGIGILILGWGDGLAALVGDLLGGNEFRVWGRRKTLPGSIVMLVASFAITLAFTLAFNARFARLAPALGVSLTVAAVAATVEILTPRGMDNITIPLASSFLYAAVFV